MTIGEWLRNSRKERKLTQEEAANGLKRLCRVLNLPENLFTRSSLANYEKDKRTPDLLRLRILTKYYGTSLDNLSLMLFEPYSIDYQREESEPESISLEEQTLIECWKQATEDEKNIIYTLLKKYGMSKPKKQDVRSSTSKVG